MFIIIYINVDLFFFTLIYIHYNLNILYNTKEKDSEIT